MTRDAITSSMQLLSDLAPLLSTSFTADESQQLLQALFVEQQLPLLLVRLLGWLQQQPQQLTQLLHQDVTATASERFYSIAGLWGQVVRCVVVMASLCMSVDSSSAAPFVAQLTQQLVAAGDACSNC
jgi:hypothetical protein